MRKHSLSLKIVTGVTLAFFCWSFLPLYSAVAFAVEKQVPGAGSRGPGNQATGYRAQGPDVPVTASSRFEKALETIRENINKADDKESKSQDITAEVTEVKKQRTEIEKIDGDLKTEFAATEKKLKDANLPKEILDRHYKFVKHYEDNLVELKTNLLAVEQSAVSGKQKKETLSKAKAHLEKTKAPSRHQKLDPNNLPFRSRKEAKPIAPRLKKEQFEKDFQKQSKGKQKLADIWRLPDIQPIRAQFKPILLASNESVSDIPFALDLNTPMPKTAFADSSQILLAQADLPSAEDLAETPEVQFTQDIRDLAAQLGNKPTKIFEWVRNNIEFVPSYGSIQGADMCLQSRQCNDIDTASLLIALLRVSKFPARYMYGTVEIPIDKAMNWFGGFTDPSAAATFMASGGIPGRLVYIGGKPDKIQMEHAWVETYIPYGNYRGAMVDDSLKTWIPMDGSYKQYTYTNGFDITSKVPFDYNAYMSQVQNQNAIHWYQSKIQEYLDANMLDTSIIDVKGYREITQETYHFLPSTLPYKQIALLGTFATAPANMAAKVMFTVTDDASGSAAAYTATTHEIAGKRITLSYIPATADDEALIAKYGGFLYDVPAYMLNLKPVLRIEGSVKLTGEATNLGSEQNMTIQFAQSSRNNETVTKKLFAGAYYAVGADLQGINENVIGKRNYKLNNDVLSETAGTLGNDDLIGEHLFILARTYFYANDKIYRSAAKLYNSVMMRSISEGITSFTLSVSHVFSMPRSARPSGVNMDVAMDRLIVVAKDGNVQKEKAYMEIAGLVSSYHEHDIIEKIDGFSSVSSVKALQVAAANAVPIQQITAANIAALLPLLQVGDEIKDDVRNAVNAGKEVTIPQVNLTINDWVGVGYIIKDPIMGSGTYRISGGLAGSDSTSQNDGMQIVEIFKDAGGWIKNQLDLLFRANIAEAAEMNLGDVIAGVATTIAGYDPQNKYEEYKDIGQCSGLVRMAYSAAGICLDEWSGCGANNLRQAYGIPVSNGVAIFYNLAAALNLPVDLGSPRDTNPMIGDMIFFNNTFDKNGDCDMSNDGQLHVGIVVRKNQDGKGTIHFIHATGSAGVAEANMNRTSDYFDSKDSLINTPLRRKSIPSCWTCPLGANCPATTTCGAGQLPYTWCTQDQWNNVAGNYASQLFGSYGTVRNVIINTP